jgi:hypothetical protein
MGEEEMPIIEETPKKKKEKKRRQSGTRGGNREIRSLLKEFSPHKDLRDHHE